MSCCTPTKEALTDYENDGDYDENKPRRKRQSIIQTSLNAVDDAGKAAVGGATALGSGMIHGVENVGGFALDGTLAASSMAMDGTLAVTGGVLHGVGSITSGVIDGTMAAGSMALDGTMLAGETFYDLTTGMVRKVVGKGKRGSLEAPFSSYDTGLIRHI